MAIITLTSDWSAGDYYIGAVKGKILSQCSDVTIVDINHNIQAFNTNQAAFVIRNAYPSFPEGSIHLIFVNTEPGPDSPFTAVCHRGHYFIGTDNGVFSLICGEEAGKIIRINSDKSVSFSALDVFTNAACKLVLGSDPEDLGEIIKTYNTRVPLRPTIEDTSLSGSVIYIDSYQNAVTNISRELFEKVVQARSFEIYVQSRHYKINRISDFYHDVPPGELVAVFNSVGLLEIAIHNGNAAQLLNLGTNSTVRIEFRNSIK
jgi:S-adenosyl-L-methionine hydrolase (adenosine-forming)